MKLLPALLGFAAIFAATSAFAETPAANPPPAAPAPAAKPGTPPATPAPVPATPMPAEPALKLDDYINELAAALKLSDPDKKEIEGLYVGDGPLLKNVLNNDALSPLQKAQQVSDLRDARNAKIEELLREPDLDQTFLKIEAKYRVALTELAADGGLVAAPAPAAK